MKIYLNEITENQNLIEVSGSDPWAKTAIAGLCEAPHAPDGREARVDGTITVSKVDGVVMAQGSLEGLIPLLCSRCGEEFALETEPRFLALYSQDPSMSGIDRFAGRKGTSRTRTYENASDPGQMSAEIDDPALDITYLSEEFIDLGEILTEQLRLQIPFQPLCSPRCRGLCQSCGTNLNTSQCACQHAGLEKQVLSSQLSGKVHL